MQNDFGNYNPYSAPTNAVERPSIGNPFREIWLQPRVTIRNIISRDATHHVLMLAAISGIGETLDRASTRSLGDQIPFIAVLAIAILLGPLGGLLSLYVGGALVWVSGRMIGGEGSGQTIRAAIAWSSVPAICALPLWGMQLALIGEEMFTTATPRMDASSMLLGVLLATAVLEMVLAIWGFLLLCNTIAEVQGYDSAWKGLGNLIVAVLLVLIPVFVLVFGMIAVF
jgi:hypothetical protein